VLGTVELLEAIIVAVPVRDILRANGVSRQWQAVIQGSLQLQQSLFMVPVEPSEIRHHKYGGSDWFKYVFVSPQATLPRALYMGVTTAVANPLCVEGWPSDEQSDECGMLLRVRNSFKDLPRDCWMTRMQLTQPPTQEIKVYWSADHRRMCDDESTISVNTGVTLEDLLTSARHYEIEHVCDQAGCDQQSRGTSTVGINFAVDRLWVRN
jgi:hypothetical protein